MSSLFIPKIIFRYAYPLDEDRRRLFKSKNLGDFPDRKTVEVKAREWQIVWDEFNQEDKIIRRMVELLGVSLSSYCEIYIFGNGLTPMSTPFIIPIMAEDGLRTNENLIGLVVHELSHKFASTEKSEKYWQEINSKYKEEPVKTQNHIIVYAIIEIVLSEIFGKDRMRELIKANSPDYQKAIEIVDDVGPEDLIKEFRNLTNF